MNFSFNLFSIFLPYTKVVCPGGLKPPSVNYEAKNRPTQLHLNFVYIVPYFSFYLKGFVRFF
jgi:hypothetical protein